MEIISLLLVVLSVLIIESAQPVGKKEVRQEGRKKEHERMREESGVVATSGRRRYSWSHGG